MNQKTHMKMGEYMRVIAGSARRIQLVTPQGMETRPTTDRIKETLFNILQYELPGCSFLDLFAGSGGIGIEALSRGASEAVFVDNSREAIRCIEMNLQKTRLVDHASVINRDCVSAVRSMNRTGKAFDIIFMDPPYQSGIEREVLSAIRESGLADADTQIIIEAALERELDGSELDGFEIERVKEYKTNKHIFLRKTVS